MKNEIKTKFLQLKKQKNLSFDDLIRIFEEELPTYLFFEGKMLTREKMDSFNDEDLFNTFINFLHPQTLNDILEEIEIS